MKTQYTVDQFNASGINAELLGALEELFESYASLAGDATPQEKALFYRVRRVLKDAGGKTP